MRRSLVLLAAALCLGTAIAATPAGKPELGTFGIDLTAMDRSVKPGDNFFHYVNGSWEKVTEIPAERSSIGAFQLLRIKSEDRMKEIMKDLEAKPVGQLSTEEKKLRDMFEGLYEEMPPHLRRQRQQAGV